uniref:Uncharacterized protein n=1 Tax=Arundo donax TaxID=35708 RepID=A0A0A8ZXE6_ARUDO
MHRIPVHSSVALDARGIVHNNQTKPETYGEERVAGTMAECNGGSEHSAERRVRGWHHAEAKEHPQVPPSLHEGGQHGLGR